MRNARRSLPTNAIASERRSPLLADVPTLDESGVKGVTVYSWQAFAAPKGLPADIKQKLHGAIVAGLNAPDVKNKLNDLGFEIADNCVKRLLPRRGHDDVRSRARSLSWSRTGAA